MNNKTKIVAAFALSTTIVSAILCAMSSNKGLFSFSRVAAEVGPSETISSVSFYENSDVESAFGGIEAPNVATGYSASVPISLSGNNWIISAGAYGQDRPLNQPSVAGYNSLFMDNIWGDCTAYQLNDSTLTEEGIFKDYLDDYKSLSDVTDETASRNAGATIKVEHKMAIMSTTTFTNVTDLAFFWRYTTANIGVIPFYKVAGSNTWQTLYWNSVIGQAGETYYPSGEHTYGGEATIVQIDGVDYPRYCDRGFIYNDNAFNNLAGKEVYLAFVVYAGANYYMDMIIDGIIINRKESAMKYLNGLNDKTICSSGVINDENTKKCFELFDRVFEVGDDLEDLGGYSIDPKFANLREGNYYSQYQYLHDKLA